MHHRARCGRSPVPSSPVQTFGRPFSTALPWPPRAGSPRGAHAPGAGLAAQLAPRNAGVVRWWTWYATGPGPGQVLSAVRVVADCGRGLGTSSRAASRRTRPGRPPGQATRSAMLASCAGSPGVRPRPVRAIVSGPVLSWPIADVAWPGQAAPHRGAHAPDTELAAQLAPHCRRHALWTWRTTGPGPGQPLSAVPVVADGRRGLGASR